MSKGERQTILAADDQTRPYRRGVGLVVFNKAGLVLAAERADNRGHWQFPQGGMDKGETIKEAALRELAEEIGTKHAKIIGEYPHITYYDFPDYAQARGGGALYGGKYRGQAHHWLALLFTGQDADIRLDANEEIEFADWQWCELATMPERIIAWKRDIYTEVCSAFAPIAAALKAGKETR